MDSFLKKVIDGKDIESVKRYFLRFGKGSYDRRFLISYNKGKRVKIKGSFEWANDFVEFVRELDKELKFSGKVMSLDKIPNLDGKKKGASFVYDVTESDLVEFENPYFYLVDVKTDDIILKIKKSIPKPGKNADKIDDKFCSLDLDLKFWDKVKDVFFWGVSSADNAKKVEIEHTLEISDVEIPKDAKPEEVREKSIRKGKLIRKITIDGKEEVKTYDLEI
ncbi:hypothetical protein CMI45_03065 [Candidatus Pacearchaeota archaeon]|nr:hypothetical protein [Candidatus Pacearchaeota archaeon]|tara:strand:- start:2889 stop:3551 length:663 start_codon:yes stop_codon:yes gene_type:complete